MKRLLYLKSAINKWIACLLLSHRLPGDEKSKVKIYIQTYSNSIALVCQGARRDRRLPLPLLHHKCENRRL